MDAVAFERTKHAFLLKIGERWLGFLASCIFKTLILYVSTWNLNKIVISLQDCCGLTCIATENDVDFLMSGYAFRLKILHERGLSLVKKQGDNASELAYELSLIYGCIMISL